MQKLNTRRKELILEIEEKKTPEEKAREAAEAAEAEAEDDDTPMPDLPSLNGNASDSELSEEGHRPLRKRKRTVEISAKNKSKLKAPKLKLSKEQAALAKLQDEIVAKKEAIKICEDKIEDVTNDLRETDCHRTRCLGRDRFCNRYWWFERNGMPYGGVPTSSTASYGYANARIWVQGPDKYDLDSMFDLSKEDEEKYESMHGITVKARRDREEGATKLPDADHYGYIDTPDELSALLNWLDDRGLREKALKKEIILWQEVMIECMEKLQKHHVEEEEKENDDLGSRKPQLRVSTRSKNNLDPILDGWKCLKWQNSAALDVLEHKHSETTRQKPVRKGILERKVTEKKVSEKKHLDKKIVEKKAIEQKIAPLAKQLTERKVSTKRAPARAPTPKPTPTPSPEQSPNPIFEPVVVVPTKRGSSRVAKVAEIEVEKRGGRVTRRSAR